jgi:AcrR family transcriptional regulator
MLSTDGRLARGERSRGAILDTAVALATTDGLDGLSLGQLARSLGVSKSGLFAHWSSKEELQLATIDRAREQFLARVVSPALRAPRGVRRLWALHESRMDYIASVELPGGCFFTNTQFEFDARPGPVRDRLAEALSEWIGLIEGLTTQAILAGELAPGTDARQLAFEINAVGVACVYQSRLLPPDEVFAQTRAAVLTRLRALCPDPTLLPED